MTGPLDAHARQAEAHDDHVAAVRRLRDLEYEGTAEEIRAARREVERTRRRWHRAVEADRAAFGRRDGDRR